MTLPFMAQSEEELKIHLVKIKGECEEVGLKLNIQKMKSLTISIAFTSICHEAMGLDAMILIF